MSKKCRIRGPFDKQLGKCAKALLKSASKHLYQIHWSSPKQFSWKKSVLLTCKILVLLVNSLTSDKKYPVLYRDDLKIPIQMQLSPKQNTFFLFLAAFLKSRLNFEYFEQKDVPDSFCISEVTDSEHLVR